MPGLADSGTINSKAEIHKASVRIGPSRAGLDQERGIPMFNALAKLSFDAICRLKRCLQ